MACGYWWWQSAISKHLLCVGDEYTKNLLRLEWIFCVVLSHQVQPYGYARFDFGWWMDGKFNTAWALILDWATASWFQFVRFVNKLIYQTNWANTWLTAGPTIKQLAAPNQPTHITHTQTLQLTIITSKYITHITNKVLRRADLNLFFFSYYLFCRKSHSKCTELRNIPMEIWIKVTEYWATCTHTHTASHQLYPNASIEFSINTIMQTRRRIIYGQIAYKHTRRRVDSQEIHRTLCSKSIYMQFTII